jgi:hypothetical protein
MLWFERGCQVGVYTLLTSWASQIFTSTKLESPSSWMGVSGMAVIDVVMSRRRAARSGARSLIEIRRVTFEQLVRSGLKGSMSFVSGNMR